MSKQFQKPNSDRIELTGTAGNIRYERMTGMLSWNITDNPVWEHEWVDGNWDAIIRNQASHFLAALTAGSRGGGLRTSLEEGLHSLRVVLAARDSNREGRSVEVGA